ncbi:MAG TPA: agmatine deiminase family protein [Polyangia bacterium]|nr:agmatine deiminase family protein [Polyangia bacterium]
MSRARKRAASPAADGGAQTPAALGFRMPAEWEPHAATWLAWPHEPRDWPGKLAPIPWVYGEVVRHLARGERVRILTHDAAVERRARALLARVGVDLAHVDFVRAPTDRSWTRDTCPLFVKDAAGEVAVTNWRFNGWAKYSNHKRDDALPDRIADRYGFRQWKPTVLVDGKPWRVVLEGGAIDVNGAGTLLATEECLLDTVQARNPGMSREETEAVLADHLGIRKVIWLGRGIAGDDTHGHVDDLCRFTDESTVVLADETSSADANYAPLRDNRERLEGATTADGQPLRVVPLPMPAPLFLDGVRLPASYANFYVANTVVLVPTFNDPHDRQALGILAELFPTRSVVGVHAVDLVWGLGTLHCMTQQEPQPGA